MRIASASGFVLILAGCMVIGLGGLCETKAAINTSPPVTVGPVFATGTRLTASDAAAGVEFGWSVAISGNTVVVGAPYDDDRGKDSGSAYVFVRSGGTWIEQQKLTASDAAAGDHFGETVAISGDIVVLGSPFDGDAGRSSGSAYVFVRSGATWMEQAKLTASDAESKDWFGVSVGVSGDTAVIGAYGGDDSGTDSGSAYLFERSGSTWSEQQKLVRDDGSAGEYYGYRVAISGDIAMVGVHHDHDSGGGSGSAYVFQRGGATWSQQEKMTAGDARARDYGYSVAISGDAAIVGAPSDVHAGGGSGSAYVYGSANTPPTITSVTASPDILWPPDQNMIPVTVTVTAEDDSGGPVTCEILSVTSNQPVSGIGAGSLSPDWVITGPLTVDLRAECSIKTGGRIYTITVECRDESGNASTAPVEVTVPVVLGPFGFVR